MKVMNEGSRDFSQKIPDFSRFPYQFAKHCQNVFTFYLAVSDGRMS